MAKVKKTSEQPGTKARGGARRGSGRKAGVRTVKTYSEKLKGWVMSALDKKAKETGRNLGDVLVDAIYDDKGAFPIRSACIKVVADMIAVKETKQTSTNIEIKQPTICLPPISVRPEEEKPQELHG